LGVKVWFLETVFEVVSQNFSKTNMTPVSIIIPAWNEAKTLRATVQALLGIDYDKRKCEVIVVAGGDDNTYETALELSPTMQGFSKYIALLQRPEGKNAAIQQGIEEANNPIIVLLDADTLVSPNWLQALVDPIEQGRCDLTIANSEPVKRNWVSDYFMIVKTYFLEDITTYPGHSMAFRADAVGNRVNYFFDATIWMGDDYVLATRMKEAGKKTMFVKNALVKTHFPCSLKNYMNIGTRWLVAFTSMKGISCSTLIKSSVIVGSLATLVPFSTNLFLLSLLLHGFYVGRRALIFMVAARQYRTKTRRILGFVFLSYVNHVLQLFSYVWYLSGMWRDTYYQGQRNYR